MSPGRTRILHCFRAPVGGLFRHVRDLAREQSKLGYKVGVVCDAGGGDTLTARRLDALAEDLDLGLHRVAMGREVGLGDLGAISAVRRLAGTLDIDILHGHGAKGGVTARLAARTLSLGGASICCFYTPHGGSLHYHPASWKGRIYMAAERHMARVTDGIIFESQFAADRFAENVGSGLCPTRVIHNGILAGEFEPVEPDADAADLVFVGELRVLKGVDVLLDAIARLAPFRKASAVIVGAGPDDAQFRVQAANLGIEKLVRFAGAMPARDAFRLGRALVMPSRAESLPYIAIEAIAAGLPLLATDVGGMGEIVAGSRTALLPAGDAGALARAIEAVLADPVAASVDANQLRMLLSARFSVEAMTDSIAGFYRDALSAQPVKAGHETALARENARRSAHR
jgi:glycosyltransferase involved in cell wall biosynthesis